MIQTLFQLEGRFFFVMYDEKNKEAFDHLHHADAQLTI